MLKITGYNGVKCHSSWSPPPRYAFKFSCVMATIDALNSLVGYLFSVTKLNASGGEPE